MKISRCYPEMLYRIRAAPVAHLGQRSLLLLTSFTFGYERVSDALGREQYDFQATFLEWLQSRYGMYGDMHSTTEILLQVAEDDEASFNLFFAELDAALAAHPEGFRLVPGQTEGDSPFPFGGLLEVLRVSPPGIMLPDRSIRCLRAFMDGYGLAAAEHDHMEVFDLPHFEYWIRRRYRLKGAFRWEAAILAAHHQNEEQAYDAALAEMIAYRATTGLDKGRRLQVIVDGQKVY
jgi:hypothetical protein